jgi:hypothetical protein
VKPKEASKPPNARGYYRPPELPSLLAGFHPSTALGSRARDHAAQQALLNGSDVKFTALLSVLTNYRRPSTGITPSQVVTFTWQQRPSAQRIGREAAVGPNRGFAM